MSVPLESDDPFAVVAPVDVSPLLPSVGASVDPLPVVSTGHPGAMNTVSETTSMSHGLQAPRVSRMEAKMMCRMARNLARQTDQPQAKITPLRVSGGVAWRRVTR